MNIVLNKRRGVAKAVGNAKQSSQETKKDASNYPDTKEEELKRSFL